MAESTGRNNIVGQYIRRKREEAGLSQRALGQLFEPAVTTQFISNIERGVTPLPPVHVGTITRALRVTDEDLLEQMEREYTAKISQRMGLSEGESLVGASIHLAKEDEGFFRELYRSYRRSDESTRSQFRGYTTSLFRMPEAGGGSKPLETN